MPARDRARTRTTWRARIAIIFMAMLGAIGGASVALLAFSHTTMRTDLATIDLSAAPARSGGIELLVPVVDWGVRARVRHVPLLISAEVATIDRAAARTAIGPSPDAPRQTVRELRSDGTRIIRRMLLRTGLLVLAGSVVGGICAAAVAGALIRARWPLTAGALTGAVSALILVSGAAFTLTGLDTRNITTTPIGRAAELSRVIAFAEQLLYVGPDYERLYRRALASVSNTAGFVEEARASAHTQVTASLVVASDLHDNAFVLGALDRFAARRTVIMAGDFGQVGARVEQRLAPRVATLGGQVIAVSGNHDSEPFMRSLAASGVTVLTEDGVMAADGSTDATRKMITVDGLRVVGYRDPLEQRIGQRGHTLRVYGKRYERQVQDVLAWWDALDERPDVVIIHQHGLAHRLLEHIRDGGDSRPLVIVTGHDHVAHIEDDGLHVLVDGGTIGAGGPFAVGEQPASFAQVFLDGRRAVDTSIVSVDPLRGDATSRQIAIGAPSTGLRSVHAAPHDGEQVGSRTPAAADSSARVS